MSGFIFSGPLGPNFELFCSKYNFGYIRHLLDVINDI